MLSAIDIHTITAPATGWLAAGRMRVAVRKNGNGGLFALGSRCVA
ncbi:MAG: hypothetical protein QOF83_2580 [Solirubrobacteraceae bacterium]|jgi:hypothetical protein|nr:hypothetical protein [Solirubrobacteraceae bacterium]